LFLFAVASSLNLFFFNRQNFIRCCTYQHSFEQKQIIVLVFRFSFVFLEMDCASGETQDAQDKLDWSHFQAFAYSRIEALKVSKSHVHLALSVFNDVLLRFAVSYKTFCKIHIDIQFLTRYASELNTVVQGRKWKRSTTQLVVCTLRKILRLTNDIAPAIVRATALSSVDHYAKVGSCENMQSIKNKKTFVKIVRACRCQSLSAEALKRVENWIELLSKTHRSISSLRTIIGFYLCTVLPTIALNIDKWPCDLQSFVSVCESKFAVLVGKNLDVGKKITWLTFFVRNILQVPKWAATKDLVQQARSEALQQNRRKKKKHKQNNKDSNEKDSNELDDDNNDDDGSDQHRLTKDDLEKLHSVAVSDVLDELFFMLLLTTGMRIGGFVNLKCSDVADLQNGCWQIKDEGKTREKGNKIFTFHIHSRVRELLYIWLNKRRSLAAMSDYIFPGRHDVHISTESLRSRFRKMCRKAGIQGTRAHPHALRHSFSHILFDLGNSPDTVAKLINHSSVATTQKYYLRESAAEAANKAIMPWLPKQNTNPVPNFLESATLPKITQETHVKHVANAKILTSELQDLQRSLFMLGKSTQID